MIETDRLRLSRLTRDDDEDMLRVFSSFGNTDDSLSLPEKVRGLA